MIDLKKRLSMEDRQNLAGIINLLNTSAAALNESIAIEILSEEEYNQYLAGVCDCVIEAKVKMHAFRKMASNKYNIPYNFVSMDGKLYIDEEENNG